MYVRTYVRRGYCSNIFGNILPFSFFLQVNRICYDDVRHHKMKRLYVGTVRTQCRVSECEESISGDMCNL